MRSLWSVAGAVLALGIVAGCASSPKAAEGAAVAAPERPAAVLEYTTRSPWETWEQWRLAQADRTARRQIEALRDQAMAASGAYADAVKRLQEEHLPPEVKRPTAEEVDALREKARASWEAYQNAFTAIVARYESFMESYPHNWHAPHRLAWFFADQGDYFRAAEQWRKVIDMEPRFPFAYNNLGTLYNHLGRDMDAVDLYLQAIEIKPDDPMFYMNLAVNYSTHRGEVAKKFGWDLPRTFRECIALMRKAIALDPKNEEFARTLASQYVMAKYFGLEDVSDEAIQAWEDYMKLDLPPEQRGVAHRNIGRILLMEKGDFAGAIAHFEKALEILGEDPPSRTLLERARKEMAGGTPEKPAENENAPSEESRAP